MQDKQNLRKTLRKARRSLSQQEQYKAAQNLTKNFLQLPYLHRAKNIALYLASDGEINPEFIIQALWKIGKNIYLPVLDPYHSGKLWFIRYTPTTPLALNRYHIREPVRASSSFSRISPQNLHLVLLPLVGFCPLGRRLGMGGGYYDRTFAFKKRCALTTPRLIGLAHECQKVSQIPTEGWDIPLDSILTDGCWYKNTRRRFVS